MSFPLFGIVDDFTRANETPLAGNWSTPIDVADVSHNLVSNQVRTGTSSRASNWWNVDIFGPDAEAYMDFVTAGNGARRFVLWIKTANENTGSLNGYTLVVNSTGAWLLNKVVAGASTNLATLSGHGAQAKMGINWISGVVSTFEFVGSWNQTPVQQVTDNAVPGAGHIGFGQTSGATTSSIFDNFGGGGTGLDTFSTVNQLSLS